jgi:hypothetical protein
MNDAPRTTDPADAEGAIPPAVVPPTRLERPTPEVVSPAGAARLPGAPREGYSKLPTGPVGVEPVVVTGPELDRPPREVDWEPTGTASVPVIADETRLAPWALMAAVVALVASFFVGWGIPLAIVAVIGSIMSLRRPVESRAIARWALVLGLCATVYSLGWLVWAGMQFERLG